VTRVPVVGPGEPLVGDPGDPGHVGQRQVASVGDIRSRLDPHSLPEGDLDQLFAIYAVIALACGPVVSLEDAHNAWAAWMTWQDPTILLYSHSPS
jgi:hypothetical protein